MKRHFTLFLLLLRKDLKLYFSGGATFWACALFSLTLLSLFRFGAPPEMFPSIAAVAILIGTHLTSSVFLLLAGQEWEWEWFANRALLLAAPKSSAMFLGKAAGYFITLSALWVFTFAGAVILLGLRISPEFVLPAFGAGLLLSLGMAFSGLLAAAVALHTRFRQLVMFLLYLPLTLPAAIAASGIVRLASQEHAVSAEWNLLIAYALVFFAAGIGLYDYLQEE